MYFYFGNKSAGYYKELRIKADRGLHEAISVVIQNNVPKGGRILDFGAGEGALSERIADLGYEVVAVDINEEDFKSKMAKFIKLDFNDKDKVERFVRENGSSFDAVLGIEVIEHIEDQWNYVRQLLAMAKPAGLVLITTPNITSWLSRIMFLFKGRFHQFLDSDLAYGHINPICAWRLGLILNQCGAREVSIRPAGTLPPIYFGGNSIWSRLAVGTLSLLTLPLYLLMKDIKNGWCVMAIARKRNATDH